jgi:hypothetical protein
MQFRLNTNQKFKVLSPKKRRIATAPTNSACTVVVLITLLWIVPIRRKLHPMAMLIRMFLAWEKSNRLLTCPRATGRQGDMPSCYEKQARPSIPL